MNTFKNVTKGTKLSFNYNGKLRTGEVTEIQADASKLVDPRSKTYVKMDTAEGPRNFNIEAIEGPVTIL